MSQIKFQNYRNYKLPISMNPLHFGNLIKQINNIFIIHVNIRNLALITQHDNFNTVELYNQGVLVIKYSDHKIDDSNFVRSWKILR